METVASLIGGNLIDEACSFHASEKCTRKANVAADGLGGNIYINFTV